MKSKYLFIILLFFITLTLTAQTRRALVIGLGMQADKTWGKINGDKDVAYVKDMLYQAGYKNVMTLINEKATKRNIVSAFNNLTAKCGDGDVVYIHFSGHGQLITDISGDEKDKWDEAWIAYDAYKEYSKSYKGENHLIDDELNNMLGKLKQKIGQNGKILVVVDACHSGTSTRGDEIVETVRGIRQEFIVPVRVKARTAPMKIKEQWITLSACKEYQLNQEMKQPQVGKLTYALYVLSKQKNLNMKQIEIFMRNNRGALPQTPVLTGETNRYNIEDIL